MSSTDIIRFRYIWPVKVLVRKLDDDLVVFNVSPKFVTAYNNVAFHWTLKLCSESAAKEESDDDDDEPKAANMSIVNVLLYYQDGPPERVDVSARVGIVHRNGDAATQMQQAIAPLCIERRRLSKCNDCQSEDELKRNLFSAYVFAHIGKTIRIDVEISIDRRLFNVFEYLPKVMIMESSIKKNGYKSMIDEILRDAIEDKHRENNHRHKKMFLSCWQSFLKMKADEEKNGIRRPVTDKSPNRNGLVDGMSVVQYMVSSVLDQVFDGKIQSATTTTDRHQLADLRNMFAYSYFQSIVQPEMKSISDLSDFLFETELDDLHALQSIGERQLIALLLNEKNNLKATPLALFETLFIAELCSSLNMLKMIATSLLSSLIDNNKEDTILLDEMEMQKLDSRMQSIGEMKIDQLIDSVRRFNSEKARVSIVII